VLVAEEAIEGRFADGDKLRERFGFGGDGADAFGGFRRGDAGCEVAPRSQRSRSISKESLNENPIGNKLVPRSGLGSAK